MQKKELKQALNEINASLSEDKKWSKEDIEKTSFMLFYVMPTNEKQDRYKYINHLKNIFIQKNLIQPEKFQLPFYIWIEKVMLKFSPITDVMVLQFFFGFTGFESINQIEPKCYKLMQPVFEIISQYYSEDETKNYLIDKYVDSKAAIDSLGQIENARHALKEFVKDKDFIPFKHLIKRLRVQYQIEEEKRIQQYRDELTGNELTGFACPLRPDIVKEIYYFMAGKYIKGDLQDFQAIFSNSSNTVINPIQWLLFNERGPNKGRGNQTALNVFLKMMLGSITNSDRRKAKDLFIDEQGYFINKSLMKPDKTKVLTYEFETGIKGIIQKADQ
jgi:hypothetical protein